MKHEVQRVSSIIYNLRTLPGVSVSLHVSSHSVRKLVNHGVGKKKSPPFLLWFLKLSRCVALHGRNQECENRRLYHTKEFSNVFHEVILPFSRQQTGLNWSTVDMCIILLIVECCWLLWEFFLCDILNMPGVKSNLSFFQQIGHNSNFMSLI